MRRASRARVDSSRKAPRRASLSSRRRLKQRPHLAQIVVETTELCSTTGKDDATIVDISGDFRRKLRECRADSRDNVTNHFLSDGIDLARRDFNRLRHRCQNLSPVDRNLTAKVSW